MLHVIRTARTSVVFNRFTLDGFVNIVFVIQGRHHGMDMSTSTPLSPQGESAHFLHREKVPTFSLWRKWSDCYTQIHFSHADLLHCPVFFPSTHTPPLLGGRPSPHSPPLDSAYCPPYIFHLAIPRRDSTNRKSWLHQHRPFVFA